MPRRSSTKESAGEEIRRSNPRRSTSAKRSSYKDNSDDEKEDRDGPEAMDVDEDSASDPNPASDSEDDEDAGSEENISKMVRRRRAAATQSTKASQNGGNSAPAGGRRPARAARFTGSMKEPPSDSVRDLFQGTATRERIGGAKGKANGRRKADESEDEDESSSEDEKPVKRRSKQPSAAKSRPSPVKSPARRHARARKSVKEESTSDEDSVVSSEAYDSEAEDELKIQRILASRTETKAKWREIGASMNSSEIINGSRWYQPPNKDEDDTVVEERFLVKWSDVSYLHVSWETQADLLDQIPNAKTYLSTFFRKSENGILLSQDDRKDGDYFDPGYTQIDRVLEASFESKCPTTWEEEMATTNETFDIVLDINDRERFEKGTGRQFLIKWEGHNYNESSWEFERDLILADIDYKPPLKAYYERIHKPSKTEWKQLAKQADRALKESYLLFGDNATTDPEVKAQEVEKYKQGLTDHVFANGGQLRDYQAEGVAWFLANYVNRRSCILADEMGLGKTLQTAAFINLLTTKMHRPGPFLVVVPLSTIAHWQREFIGWTGLNTIVYHGSQEDRANIRIHEFAYPQDRPQSVGSNTIYLNKCVPHKNGGPWMATVVVATPEMLVADDYNELAAVDWEVLVVDEAHRLKNHNSKLATTLRKDIFSFKHKVLLTGTPIQNDMKEFWTLLNFIDSEKFPDMDEFLEQFGNMKSKEHIDEMHEAIRPYILRRLKEDVEKSVPPKEETLIEVELTLQQKQYYRALYEKNVAFLQKNKKKALDGPSLNNLAMQLRKCCNHLFLLNGVEEEIRKQKDNQGLSEADILVRGSGKLVLLDKLLPRLKENGHRLLIFSQFKIMLDVLEDYLVAKQLKFERIDGSITGHRRQAAIDRFQDPTSQNPPFIMLLSTRAGGVGINLTSADTCIIFDSDWNPQNDLQAQARCHRIGQTKNVKVYRLLSRKSYEMQMFHMSSLKMGLDQAVLKGFESGAAGEGAMTKEEVERLLRHGAYDIFNEEKAGAAEAESKDFIEQDIDSILERRAKTVVHDNTGSGSNAAGGTFSKASFVAPKTPGGTGTHQEDVDIEDPDFWKKMVGEAKPEAEVDIKPRKRNQTNYSEKFYQRELHRMIALDPDSDNSDSESDDSDESSDEHDEGVKERARWGGQQPYHWKKSQALKVLASIERHGYNVKPWEDFRKELLPDCAKFSETEVQRMVWSIVLLAFCEVTKEDSASASKRAERQAERKRENEREGDILAMSLDEDPNVKKKNDQIEPSFAKLWHSHSKWAALAVDDAVAFARKHEPRSTESKESREEEIAKVFYGSLWDSLKGRGWKEEETDGGKVYKFEDHKFDSPSSVLNEVVRIHPELTKMVVPLLNTLEQTRMSSNEKEAIDRARHLAMNSTNVTFETLMEFLTRYAPLQLIGERKHAKRLPVGRRVLSSCSNMHAASFLIEKAAKSGTELKSVLSVDGRSALPHPLWTLDHDAVLIKAIVKHGWIDRDKACRKIVGDPEIKWGFPFELSEAGKGNKLSDEEWADLRATAGRASAFMEDSEELLETLKAVNKHLIIESYGLKHNLDGSGNDGTAKWNVDDDSLLQASKKDDGTADVREPVDLPTKKDLAKRAKLVLQRSTASPGPGGRTSFGKSTAASVKDAPGHGFAVIDQGNRCCILLAEMIRGICKGSFSKAGKQVKLLCSIAYAEAMTLAERFSSKTSKESKELGEEMAKIANQIQLARKCMQGSAGPSKNLFRVMIGLEPIQTKIASDPVFPSQDYVNKLTTSGTSFQPKKEAVLRKDEGALGDKALVRSLKKAVEKSPDGKPNRFSASDDPEVGLQLAMSEVLVLQVFCSNVMPLSSAAANAASVPLSDWQQELSMIGLAAREFLCSTKEKFENANAALMKLNGQDNDSAQTDAGKKVLFATWEEAMADEAVRFYDNSNAEAVGKKSVLLLEKVRRFAFSNTQTSQKVAHKYENYLGPKVLNWFSKELTNLAHDFNVMENDRAPMALSTTDLLGANPDFTNTTVAAYLDKKAARQVISQISLLARLRCLLMKSDEKTFREKLLDAIGRSRKLADIWEKRPAWWDDDDGNVEHSYVLLKMLDEHGFANILEAKADFGPSNEGGKSFRSLGFTKASIQQRANQLVRELHAIDEMSETMRLLEERRNRGVMKKQGYDRSLAECHTSKTTSSGGGIQTGLKAFFVSTKSISKKSKVVLVTSNDENVTSVLAAAGKRKESPLSSQEENSPTEKEAKKLAPLFQMVPGKRKDSPSSVASTDKKMRTIVNPDGVIELVSIPK